MKYKIHSIYIEGKTLEEFETFYKQKGCEKCKSEIERRKQIVK